MSSKRNRSRSARSVALQAPAAARRAVQQPTATPQSSIPEVQNELHRLHDEVDSLLGDVKELGDRLELVLRPVPGTTQHEQGPKVATSSCGMAIADDRERITVVRESLRAIVDRLAI